MDAQKGAVTIDGKMLRGSRRYEETALNLIRGLGYRYTPGGSRGISARTDYGLAPVQAIHHRRSEKPGPRTVALCELENGSILRLNQ